MANKTTVPETFTRVNGNFRNRVIMTIEGEKGTGKTDLALTAPPPVAFFKFDLNTEFTLSRYAAKKEIYQREYPAINVGDSGEQKKAQENVQTFTSDYRAVLAKTSGVRTVVWDTATELWELMRFAAFGRLSNVQHLYTPLNIQFRNLMNDAFNSDKNLIMIHRMKDEYVDNKRTGRVQRAGYGDIDYAAQVMVQTFFSPIDPDDPASQAEFSLKVLKCTQNPLITERVYRQEGDLRTNSFSFLAADVFPGTSPEEWS